MHKDSVIEKPLAIVTGSSSGIGLELAREFARNGYDLMIVAEDSGIEAISPELVEMGASVEAMQLNLAEFDNVERLVDRIHERGRPLAAAAINAGVGVHGDFAHETDLAAELKMIELNVMSTVHLAKRLSRDMVARGKGQILFTSSVASKLPAPYMAVYGASKAFVQSFAQALRSELKDTGVTVTSLMPGPTDTNFFERADMLDTKVGASSKDDPAVVARQGFKAMIEGRDHVVAGSLMNNLMTGVAKVVPETVATAMHRRMVEPRQTAEQSSKPSVLAKAAPWLFGIGMASIAAGLFMRSRKMQNRSFENSRDAADPLGAAYRYLPDVSHVPTYP